MLTLGIPGNPTMAMMIGALMIHGIAPGPRVMTERPGLFWGLIASMWIGNLMLVVLNLPLVGIWVKLLRIPYRLLYPAIIVFCCIGVYTITSKPFDLYVMAFFAIFGYLALKLDCEPAPLILGFVLGPMMEENLRRAADLARRPAWCSCASRSASPFWRRRRCCCWWSRRPPFGEAPGGVEGMIANPTDKLGRYLEEGRT